MKLTFNRSLLIGFGLSMLFLILSSTASLVSIIQLRKSAEQLSRTQRVMQNLEKTISTLKDAETGQRGYLLTSDSTFLDPYFGALERAKAFLRKVKTLTSENPQQQVSSDQLQQVLEQRMNHLKYVVDRKAAAGAVPIDELRLGKVYMDKARDIINEMEAREEALVNSRNAQLTEYGKITPAILVVTSVIAIGIAIFFYQRLRKDYNERLLLANELANKDKDITRRISIIEDVANKISQGEYNIRTKDDGETGLGTLSASLNKMASSLEHSFQLLEDKEWHQKGIRELAESLLGVQNMRILTDNILRITAKYSGSNAGALYLVMDDEKLYLNSQYALSRSNSTSVLSIGEGVAGECLAERRILRIDNIASDSWNITSVAGELKPRNIVAIPMMHEGDVKGVLELVSINDYSHREQSYFEAISAQTGILIHTLQSNIRVRDLLQETQAQAEELQTQHSELENINSELEAQTQKLQASEEELKVQQEELMEANSELEERAHLLEERNEMINARNKEIQQKAEELAQSTKYKSEFLANMSHELRTPLNSILLLSKLMADNDAGKLGTEEVEYANVINNAGKGLLSLIDEILDLSKIEAGKMQLELEELPLAEVAGNMQDLFAPQANAKKIELNISMADDVPDLIETDKLRLEQILKNLLANAIKFTSTGSVSLRITRGASDTIQFAVQDTGIGIPADSQESIFGAFQQADGSTRRKYGGTGLGLAISRELAILLGGAIVLQSTPGEGSTFSLSIPIKGVVQEEGPAATNNGKTSPPQQPEPTSAGETYKRKALLSEHIPTPVPDDRDRLAKGDNIILIVEDDPAFAKVLLDFTRKRGYKGLVAVRGDDGLKLAYTYSPSAILLDIQLPVMDGWEVMQELKNNPATKHIPVHIMSAHAEMRRELLQHGAVNFTPKPIAPEGLASIFGKIEDVLNRESKKVLIIEDNPKHAKALADYLENFNISTEITSSIDESVTKLSDAAINCVIMDMGIPDKKGYQTLEAIKKSPGLEQLPIIIFTGKSLSKTEEERIRQYADSIVVKTAHSYQRMLDEVSLFLHLMEQQGKPTPRPRSLGRMTDVLKDKTILITDDDVRNIFSLSRVLDGHGVKVITATDGNEALKQLEEHPETDLVLMDMMMPGLDGYDTTTAIRKDPKLRTLPVIAVTAKAMMGDRDKCMEAGASDYITKPVDVDQLLSLLRVWLYER